MSARPSEFAHLFARHMHDLHDDIRKKKSTLSNDSYKEAADGHGQFREFEEGDYVMIRVRSRLMSTQAPRW